MNKAVIKITERAANRVRELIDARDKPAFGIRVGIKTGGCSGLEYKFEYADEASNADEVVEEHGIKILIERNAILYLIGTTLDFVDEEVRSGFVFNNPNAKNTCGCGESFNV
jgi:iron-sulfur cluster assembly protein